MPKPTIAVGILDVELQQMPLVEPSVSGVHNFTYVLSTHPIQKDLAAFHRIHPFAHLAVVVSENLKGRLDFESFFERLAAPYGAEVELIFWEKETPLPALSDAVDAVYLAVVFERSPEEVGLLSEALAERKLPSFAMSRSYVDAGIMACIDQIFRKLALIVEGVALGEELAAMPVRHNLDEQWVLNAATIRRIGFDLSFETLFSARFLKADEPTTDRRLSLQEIIAEGLQSNLDLRIEKRNVDLAGQDMRRAKSSLLPTVETSTTLLQVDPNVAERALGQQPERTGAGTGTVQQVLFSEQVFANVKIQPAIAPIWSRSTWC
ncbi:MAG: TolC family protein [Candidatus Latescibacteria bacterium]|nr:TolC family protein [Candidatus Latescibacterota bacterium]